MNPLDRRIAALSPAQRALLKQQFAQRGIAWTWPDEDDATAALPLSPAQQHLWVVQQLMPDSAAYHIAFTWHIHGGFSSEALAQALQQLVDRHAALRTVFEAGPVQRVLPHATITLGRSDLRQQPPDADALNLTVHGIVHQPFDLAQAPLMRAHLLRLADEQHMLVWVLHHLVADGWSRGVLMREMEVLYQAALTGQAAELPALPLQYADHVRAQRRWQDSDDCLRQSEHWRRQLADLAPLNLPSDRPRTRHIDHRSQTVSQVLPGIGPALKAAAARCGATPFMLLLTAFQVLLYRHSGQRDLAVGIPVAGRNQPELAGLIGFFVNTLVIRTAGPEQGRFTDWVQAVKHAVVDAFEHQDLPLAKVIEAVSPPREAGRNPLFDVMFQYQGQGYGTQNAAEPTFAGLALTQAAVPLAQTKFDMTWHAIERGDDLLLAVEYRTALYDLPRIERLIAHFDRLLRRALATPDQRIGALPALALAELAQIEGWQRGPVPPPKPAWHSFIDRFEQQAARTPDAVAADAPTPGSALSYRALDQAAQALADRLRARGIGAETLVGVCLPRTPALMVALLGVLKAGAAYLALDPSLPHERLRYMARDSGAALLISLQADADRLFANLAGPDAPLPACLCLDAQPTEPVGTAPQPAPRTPIHPDQLAYVLYTSGSTGAPKGTLLTHGGLIHYLDWCLARYPLSRGRGAPVNSSIGFDATITGLFAPLLTGQCVTLLPESDPLALLADAMAGGYSLVKVTPAHMNALAPLLETRPAIDPADLPRAFVIGGESLSESHVAFWRERFPGIALINEYGPTETVVGCCVHEVQPGDRGAMPIGRPITGAAMYLLDADLNPVPPGAVGEIFIGGTGMARGYLNRRALTAERFLPDPFGGAAAVMYRTGDLARWRPDGVIDYLGRADQQLQLRGYRIEAGEVESALARQPGVAEAVVGVRQVGPAPALVAWLTPQAPGSLPSADDLRRGIRPWLPPYMVPSHIIELALMPLTTNGKVDRGALPDPVLASAAPRPHHALADDRSTASAGPEDGDPTLATLRTIWQDVLKRDHIGAEDNFFDLGGDSVAAMQIVARAHRAGLALTPASVFEHQTLAAQATIARPAASSATCDPSVLEPGRAVPLSPAQWAFFERVRAGTWPEPHHYNQSVLLDVDPALDPARLQAALQGLPQQHAALRLRFTVSGDGQWAQTHVAQAAVPLDLLDLSDEADPLASMDGRITAAQGSLNLQEGPLLKAMLVRLGADRGARLLLLAHHLVVDGVSWRLLVADLLQAYALGTGSEAPHTSPQAPAFAHWTQHLQAQGDRFEQEAEGWTQRQGQPSLMPSMPAPWAPVPGQRMTEASASELSVALDPLTTTRLLGLHQSRPGTTAEELMVTALAQTLAQWARTSTLTIDLEGHGRSMDPPDGQPGQPAPEVSGTVGWFTAVYPLSLSLPQGSAARQLDAVQAAWRELPGRGLGHGVLRMRGLASASPAQVSFNYLGRLEVPGAGFVRGLAPEVVPSQRSPRGVRSHALEVVALVRGDQLRVLWRHDAQQHRRAVVEQLARRCVANLQSLLALTAPSPSA